MTATILPLTEIAPTGVSDRQRWHAYRELDRLARELVGAHITAEQAAALGFCARGALIAADADDPDELLDAADFHALIDELRDHGLLCVMRRAQDRPRPDP